MINDNTIGYSVDIILKGFNGNNDITAKVDTGADLSSLHANNVRVNGKTVEFDFGDRHITMPLYGYQRIKTADGGTENRPTVEFSIEVPKYGTDKDIIINKLIFTLNDRSGMDDKILLGVNFIEAGKFTIVSDSQNKKDIVETSSLSILDFISTKNINLNELYITKTEDIMKLSEVLEEALTEAVKVTYNKDNISTLKDKLKAAKVDVSNMTDEMVLKFANMMKEIDIE